MTSAPARRSRCRSGYAWMRTREAYACTVTSAPSSASSAARLHLRVVASRPAAPAGSTAVPSRSHTDAADTGASIPNRRSCAASDADGSPPRSASRRAAWRKSARLAAGSAMSTISDTSRATSAASSPGTLMSNMAARCRAAPANASTASTPAPDPSDALIAQTASRSSRRPDRASFSGAAERSADRPVAVRGCSFVLIGTRECEWPSALHQLFFLDRPAAIGKSGDIWLRSCVSAGDRALVEHDQLAGGGPAGPSPEEEPELGKLALVPQQWVIGFRGTPHRGDHFAVPLDQRTEHFELLGERRGLFG